MNLETLAMNNTGIRSLINMPNAPNLIKVSDRCPKQALSLTVMYGELDCAIIIGGTALLNN